MTITDNTNYCSTCQEVCWHHPTNCSVCGAALEAAPRSSTSSHGSVGNIGVVGVSPIPDALREESRLAGRELRQMLSNIRQQLQQVGQDQQALLSEVQNMRQQWQNVPAARLDPHLGNTSHSNSRPTSKAFLDRIPRVVLKKNSSLLYQATLKIDGLPAMEGILGDFDSEIKPLNLSANLVLAHPRTGLGGLSPDTQTLLQNQFDANSDSVVLFERGDGVTFVRKAFYAQSVGACACIIANHVAEPWPYVMKDSTGEASQNGGLRIPTVMVKKSDAQHIWKLDKNQPHCARLQISQQVHDCVVCTDALASGSTVMRLPTCGHLFHQDCVLQWLNKHNTCPFCRRELPTDDEEYEQERRREQRTHAGSSGNANPLLLNDFYG